MRSRPAATQLPPSMPAAVPKELAMVDLHMTLPPPDTGAKPVFQLKYTIRYSNGTYRVYAADIHRTLEPSIIDRLYQVLKDAWRWLEAISVPPYQRPRPPQ